MQERHVFEYAVIRVVPKVEREEFLNVGVVLYCAKHKFLQMRFKLDKDRLSVFDASLDLADIKRYLLAFEAICAGGNSGGAIGAFPMPDRFRWLTATRSTILQTSKVHLGLCDQPSDQLDRLFEQLVL